MQKSHTEIENILTSQRLKKEEKLKRLLTAIAPLDGEAMELAQKKWNSIAHPLHSLGKLEDAVIQIAGIQKNAEVSIEKKALIIMCADNGIVEEGVTQTGQEVTAIVAENFLNCNTSAAIMCEKAGAALFPIDIGMAVDTKVPRRKSAYGTRNFRKETAMTREDAVQAILTGIEIVGEKVREGYELFATGEMGIGNTTTSSAVAAVLLGVDAAVMTGRGAGLSDQGLQRKKQVIREAIQMHQPDPKDPVDVLSKVGGFDLAGLAGVCLAGAIYQVPVVLDGFISAVAALAAVRMCTGVKEYLLPSHISKEPGTARILEEFGMEAPLHCEMCLGEGTGAAVFFPVLDMGVEVYRRMSTFSDNRIEDYQEFDSSRAAEERMRK